MNKKSQANVSSIKLDSFYVLTKGINGVKAKFIGAPQMDSKKKAIWVPKSLVTNLKDTSKFGYLKRIDLFCRSITKPKKGIGFLIMGALNT